MNSNCAGCLLTREACGTCPHETHKLKQFTQAPQTQSTSSILGGKIVGMVQFDGRLIIATESGVFEYMGEVLRPIPLEVVE